MKKNPMQFTIRFNGSIPSHQKAAARLNQCGHMKAHFIAAAVEYYMANGGEVPQYPTGDLAEAPVPDAAKEDENLQAGEPVQNTNTSPSTVQDTDNYDLIDGFDDTDMENILASMTMMGNIDDSY